MAYRKSTYDPNYQMNPEDLRQHRRLNLALVPLFLLFSMQMLEEDPSIFIQAAWVMYIVVELGILMGFGYSLWAKDERAILEDELSRHHQAIAYKWGFLAALAMGVLVVLIAPYGNLDTREAGMVVVLAAMVAASMRFALLERDDELEEE